MKKILAVMICMCMCGAALFAQDKPDVDAKPSAEIEARKIASALATYGYENESASALLEAAEILAQTPTQPLNVSAKKEGTSSNVKAEQVMSAFTAEQLLADGKKFAGKDKTMIAWANDIEKALKQKTRGAIGGPKTGVDFAYGNGGTVTFTVPFSALRFGEVYVTSLDGADMDVYIYDGSGLIASDTSYSKDAYASFFCLTSGTFGIVVKNNSPYNARFAIDTN